MQPEAFRLARSGLTVPHTGYTVTAYHDRKSHDGVAFTATLRLHRTVIGTIENEGTGGPTPSTRPAPATGRGAAPIGRAQVPGVGAETFETYIDIADVEAAFTHARCEAMREHGCGGYTGTIAEKDDYVVITQTPMSAQQAVVLADSLLASNDPRVVDTWGQAGAIPVKRSTSTAERRDPDGWLFVGWASY